MTEQSMPEKLVLIARCIREGREMERKYNPDCVWKHYNPTESDICRVHHQAVYRAKPEKPRTGVVNWTEHAGRCMAYEAIELTPEVRQALEDAGLI